MYKVKTFYGNFNTTINGNDATADSKFNEWIMDHQDIEIIEFQYKHARHGDHSIAILYVDHSKGGIV